MNEITNKFLLAGHNFMADMNLEQVGFTYSASETFIKNKRRSQKFQETGDYRYIYQNKLNKACFQLDTTYGEHKDFPRKRVSDNYYVIKNLLLLQI